MADAYANRAYQYDAEELIDKAIADLTRAIQLKPDWPQYYSDRGTGFYQQKQYSRALADFNKAISLKPDTEYYYHQKAITFLDQKLYDDSIAACDQAVNHATTDSDRADAFHCKAWALHLYGKDDRALVEENKAASLNPKRDEIHADRAIIYEKLGRRDEALAEYDQTLALNPANRIARRALQRLVHFINSDSATWKISIDSQQVCVLNPGGSCRTLLQDDLGEKRHSVHNEKAGAHYDDAVAIRDCLDGMTGTRTYTITSDKTHFACQR